MDQHSFYSVNKVAYIDHMRECLEVQEHLWRSLLLCLRQCQYPHHFYYTLMKSLLWSLLLPALAKRPYLQVIGTTNSLWLKSPDFLVLVNHTDCLLACMSFSHWCAKLQFLGNKKECFVEIHFQNIFLPLFSLISLNAFRLMADFLCIEHSLFSVSWGLKGIGAYCTIKISITRN